MLLGAFSGAVLAAPEGDQSIGASVFKYQTCVVVKSWMEPGNEDAGINVSTGFAYAETEKEARKLVKAMLKEAPDDALQKFGFYTRITVVEP